MTLLRAILVIAILAGIGTFAVGQWRVAEKINRITEERDRYLLERDQAQAAEEQARETAREAQTEAERLTGELTDTKAALEEASARAIEQERRANTLQEQLTETTRERNEYNRELVRYQQVGSVEQFQELAAENKSLRAQRNAFAEENKVLLRRANQLQDKIDRLLGEEEPEVALPEGLTGHVIAVDPKWDFVVLDIGSEQGVLENGEMMLSRDGKLIGKVRIASVEPNRSIANVIQSWKQEGVEVMEGDRVIY